MVLPFRGDPEKSKNKQTMDETKRQNDQVGRLVINQNHQHQQTALQLTPARAPEVSMCAMLRKR
jgi:hypothetical protein